LNYLAARKQIYIPAYVYHVVHNALPQTARELERRIHTSDVVMHDVEHNGDINDLNAPLAHSSILVNLLNVLLTAPLPPFNKEKFGSLREQVDAFSQYRTQLKKGEREILDELITFAYLFSPNPLEQTFALRTIKRAELDSERLLRYQPIPETMQPYQECF